MKDMDFPFIRHGDEDFDLKEDLFGNRLSKSTCETMNENWPSSTDDMLESIFPMDFLNNMNDQESFCGLEDFPDHIKMEAEDYEISVQKLPEPLLSQKSDAISSNSSDSGLSSDNLEVEMSPLYEPLSPSPRGATISECGTKRQQMEEKCLELNQPAAKKVCTNEQKPKVIVQKVPQVMTLNSTVQANAACIQPQKNLQHYKQLSHQQALVKGVRGNEIKIVKLSPQMFTTPNKKPVTIQVKNSNSGAKIQAKPGTLFLNKTKLSEMKKIIRVPNSNPRSVLIPVSLHDVKELRSFKIVNTTTAVRSAPAKVIEPSESNDHFQFLGKSNEKDDSFMDNSSDCDSIIIEDGYNNDEYVHDPEASYPKLMLTSEEKRLLSKEGITLPSHYPLTKHEERELKRIRRKIRNKISAQDSRKRKKEYVDGLEERVKQCTEENQTLMKRIKQLQNQNQNLVSQMKKLQTLLTKGTNKTTQPTTCLMVLLLSLALVAAPNLKLGQNAKETDLEEAVQETILQNRRSLLFNNKGQSIDVFDEEVNMSDIVTPISECESIIGRNSNSKVYPSASKCKKMNLVHPEFIDNVDEANWYLSKNQVESSVNSFANYAQDNKDHFQTSGFNIERESTVKSGVESDQHSWLDKDILEMVTPTANGLYELNMDKIVGGSLAGIPDMPTKHVYTNEVNINNSSSGVRQIKEY